MTPPDDDTIETDRPEPIEDDAIAPFEAAASALERSLLETQMARLRPREQQILRSRLGLDGTTRTFGEIVDALDLPLDVIRHIEEVALSKLRHPSVARLGFARRSGTAG